MHETLFTHQDALADIHLLQYAAALDLEMTQFCHALAEHAYQDRVREDFIKGVRIGVNSSRSVWKSYTYNFKYLKSKLTHYPSFTSTRPQYNAEALISARQPPPESALCHRTLIERTRSSF